MTKFDEPPMRQQGLSEKRLAAVLPASWARLGPRDQLTALQPMLPEMMLSQVSARRQLLATS